MLLLAAVVLALIGASPAAAARPLELGFSSFGDGLFVNPDPAVRNLWLDRAGHAGAGIVLLGAQWSADAPRDPPPGFDPRNPADPAYSWGRLDPAVRDATAHGFQVMILLTRAPTWAEGPGRPGNAPEGAWKPDPGAVGDFAAALATRYSGRFVDPFNAAAGALPAVRLWQLWAEPNLELNLAPQYVGRKRWAPDHYRLMLDAFYREIEGVDAQNKVVTGGLAPYGDPPGGDRTRPLAYLRDLLCLRGREKLKRTKCSPKPHFDVLADNPITLGGGPRLSAIHHDDVSSADLGKVRKVLRAAERRHTIRPRGRHQLWATEFWWASKPPSKAGVNARLQARWIEKSLQLYWKAGARVAITLQIRDTALKYIGGTGLYYINGEPKPAVTAFRFPFVAERHSKRIGRAWGKAPVAGKLRIERKTKRGWRTVKRLNVRQGSVFNTKLRLKGAARLRARVGSDTSIVWPLRG